jgi:hypothetical protein
MRIDKTVLLAMAVAAATGGCAETVWRHPAHQDKARLEAESKLCDDLAQQSVPLYITSWAHHQARVHEAFTHCMFRLGYYRAAPGAPAAAK